MTLPTGPPRPPLTWRVELTATAPPTVSVVIGSVESERTIRECVSSVVESCSGLDAEIIVVDASRDATAARVRMYFPHVLLIQLPSGTLTPVLWSTGISHARGFRIALTNGHCFVKPEWARDLITALDTGAAGAGGPIELRRGSSMVDRAIYLLRYSAFLPAVESGVSRVLEIAGDNAMYTRAALERHDSTFGNGLWDVELNKLLREEGRELLMVQGAAVSFGASFPLAVVSRHRFAHGRHFGAWRVRENAVSPLRIVVTAPLVPFVLFARIGARVLRHGRHRLDFLVSSVFVLWLAACWAAGEAAGAMDAGASHAHRH